MKTVLHLSSGDDGDWQHALANAENLLGDDTLDLDATAFVANGDAVRLLLADSEYTDRITALLDRGMDFFACSNSLRGREIDPDTLLPGVGPASSGVGELTRRQDDGYAYVKIP